ncbi:MAG TPA: hypothetical protein VLA91_02445, partial [Acidimicrobiia bacterium]|nr:hypothetical protein [Acidimicrobiia bacterium]
DMPLSAGDFVWRLAAPVTRHLFLRWLTMSILSLTRLCDRLPASAGTHPIYYLLPAEESIRMDHRD